ncbi:chaperonin 10-like protein [Melanogaster broomeanus]|nr:chaperonin 10-like protein [Melanogaster broomeanus]
MAPLTQKALWLPEVGADFTVGTTDIPDPGPGEALVKLEASALNPIDWKVQKHGFVMVREYPAIIGQEAAGVVVKVGEDVTNLVKGDKVIFHAPLSNKYSAYKEYTLVAADLAAKIPDNISFDDAASIPASISPFVVGFYSQQPHGFALTLPFEGEGGVGKYSDYSIIIMGGASSLGQYAIQLAKISGFSPIIATASLHNKDLLLSLGATHVLDRKLSSDALKEELTKITATPVSYAFDAVSLDDTQQAAYDLLAPGGKLAIVLPPAVKPVEGSGKEVIFVFGSFQLPQNRELGARFFVELTKWLAEGKIKPNAVEVLPGGLSAVSAGLKRLENNAVSARKLVIRPAETVV